MICAKLIYPNSLMISEIKTFQHNNLTRSYFSFVLAIGENVKKRNLQDRYKIVHEYYT